MIFMYDYILKRSDRRTLSLKIGKDLKIYVNAPFFVSKAEIDAFVEKHSQWIDNHLQSVKRTADIEKSMTTDVKEQLRNKAREYIIPRVKYYSDIMRLVPSGVKITSAKTRFGSCSGKNSLCFSYMLMLYPAPAIDYVVVHELAHIKHHNHSKAFYKLIEQYLPDYKERVKLLRSFPEQPDTDALQKNF